MQENFLTMNTDDIAWRASSFAEGVFVKDLGHADGYALQMVRFNPGAKFAPHLHEKAEFMYILDGELMQNNQVLKSGYFSISQIGTSDTDVYSEIGCTFIILSGI